MKKALLFLLTCLCFTRSPAQEQLLVVITHDWDAVQGTLQRFESDGAAWQKVGEPISIVVGRAGLAWGVGLHPEIPVKREGDRKAPAGMFKLGPAFGFSDNPDVQMSYLFLDEDTEAVDDSQSIYYNQIVNRHTVSNPDWNSSEKMRQIPLYEIGLVVQHNWIHPIPLMGSAIFIHIWRNDHSGTWGCTAMRAEDLYNIISWIDEKKNPVLVQLPIAIYQELQNEWRLPNL